MQTGCLTYVAELNLLDILESVVVFICYCMLVPSGPNIHFDDYIWLGKYSCANET